eukprot:CAMPEP_0198289702 /NCGR_PEP_ID=MMETSP1449-20131203/7808_1 /TAXON_ID=420275 /ORGANISM="Attheya septentrionalis, Strain CCMP2084" /LENGTH=58 /DNA_ID=CAMNT_0043988077 /DNA_START=65 /DNA_END=238 /DNA_ORIENTATION=+
MASLPGCPDHNGVFQRNCNDCIETSNSFICRLQEENKEVSRLQEENKEVKEENKVVKE